MAYLTKRKNSGGKYYIRWREGSKISWKSTGEKSRDRAQAFYDRWKRDKHYIIGNYTVSELFEKKLDYMQLHFKKKTVSIYSNTFRHYLNLIGNCPLSKVLPEDLETYKIKRMACKTTINIEVRTLKATFKYASSPMVRMLNESPFKDIRQFSIQEKNRVYIPDHNLRLILGHCKNLTVKNIIIHALSTAMRLNEICGLKYKDINLTDRIIEVTETKTNNNRIIPINDQLYSVLKSYYYDSEVLKIYDPDSRIYDITGGAVSHAFKRIVRRLRLPETYKFHCLRHTAITNLLRYSKNINISKEIAGHKSISTTQIYLHNIPEEIRQAVNMLVIS